MNRLLPFCTVLALVAVGGGCGADKSDSGTTAGTAAGSTSTGTSAGSTTPTGSSTGSTTGAATGTGTGTSTATGTGTGTGSTTNGELTINGDFELGTDYGWTSFAALNGGTFDVTQAEASGGLWSGNVNAPGPSASPLIKQANIGIGVVGPNTPVTISFDLKGSMTGEGGVVFAEFFSELAAGGTSKTEILGGGPLFPTDTWTTYSYSAVTGPDVSGGVTLQLKAACGAVVGCTVDAYFDNASVTVP